MKNLLLFGTLLASSTSFAAMKLDCVSADGKTVITTVRTMEKEIVISLRRENSNTYLFRVHPLTLQNNLFFVPEIDAGNREIKVALGRLNPENKYPRSRLSGVIGPYLQADDTVSRPESLKADLSCTVSGDLEVANVCTEEDEATYTERLFAATAKGETDKVQQALACGADMNAVNEAGCTPLMVSALTTKGDCGYPAPRVTDSFFYHKKKFIFNYLLTESPELDAQDPSGETAAHKAVRNGEAELVPSLKSANANLDVQDDLGMTPIMRAALMTYEKGVTELVKAQVDLEKRNALGQTAYELGIYLSPKVRSLLLPGSNTGIIISGSQDGSCTPRKIEIKMGAPTKITLKASSRDMFLLTSKDLGINLMAMANGEASQILTTNKMGSFKFECGVHGGKQSVGQITVVH